jgi:hypothetical protein
MHGEGCILAEENLLTWGASAIPNPARIMRFWCGRPARHYRTGVRAVCGNEATFNLENYEGGCVK